MPSTHTLFEVSFEVCNKIGGIHTVLATKAKTLVERYGDDYVCIGPWLLSDDAAPAPFTEEFGYEAFIEQCRGEGVNVRVGRWEIPGRPRTILVEFSSLYEAKDELFAQLWDEYRVDSISGGWDYVEPVLFGLAAGRVIEAYWESFLSQSHRRGVGQFHEWMTGAGLLHLKSRLPNFGTVFTTHATMLGRALSSTGSSPEEGLGGETPEELAERHEIVAKHSLEGVCAREADVFTTVSEITAKEAELLHGRMPEPLLPNGIDLEVLDRLAGDASAEEVAGRLRTLASQFVGEDVTGAALLAVSGRYEFHNKGVDVLLEALAQLDSKPGRQVVLFILVPAGNSGVRQETLERLAQPLDSIDGPLGISTHNLFDEENDPIHAHCERLGLVNAPGSRVKIVHVPIYLSVDDDLLRLPYEAVLRAMDLTCFPSFYEPWGYTPQESLAVGVPTVTTDYAGFGRWVQAEGLEPASGVTVLSRVRETWSVIVDGQREVIEAFLVDATPRAERVLRCRETAERTAWTDLSANYHEAFGQALAAVQERLKRGVTQPRRQRVKVPLSGSPRRPRLAPFDVRATLPDALRPLERLSRNFWWSWDTQARSVFEELSPRAWVASGNNPVSFLARVYPEDLAEKAADAAYVAKLKSIEARFDAYLRSTPEASEGLTRAHPVAYFCAEYGLHESLPIYSGGLGVLAGDHLKSASDIGLPLVAVGLFYHMGYMAQRLTSEGEQRAVDLENDPAQLPLARVVGADGKPLVVSLGLPGRRLSVQAWRVDVGRVPLYLLDTNRPENREEDRAITRNLYGGDEETRLLQELVLGRGGARLLAELGISPAVYHMNEGHAAFLALERVGRLVRRESYTFEEAREFVRSTTAFTTHTPVPAGHDRFGEDLVRRYFSDVTESVGLPWERFFALGGAEGDRETFNMTYLALNFAGFVNGVSKLHGIASRDLLQAFWPALLTNEVPVTHVTNGVHLATWTDPALGELLGVKDGLIGPDDFEQHALKLDSAKLWSVKQASKRRLIAHIERSLETRFLERCDSPIVLQSMLDGLREDALFIGFARRFAPYKRAHLLLQDAERLAKLLNDEKRPMRILIAGKAHPRDGAGQEILKGLAEAARSDRFTGRILFLEDYDMKLARDLVQGVDVWLNNPTRMLEASGTSGMKAAAGGALNLSVGDGWWPEGYNEKNGWMIAAERVYEDQTLQDQLDGAVLYRLIEEEVLPLFFARGANGIPEGWLDRVRDCLATVPAMFNTDRMVREYARKAYSKLAARFNELSSGRRTALREGAARAQRIRRGFDEVRIQEASVGSLENLRMGDAVEVHVDVELGTLQPDDVRVELVLGHPRDEGNLQQMTVVELNPIDERSGSLRSYTGSREVGRSGGYAYGIRVRAKGDDELNDGLRGLTVWA